MNIQTLKTALCDLQLDAAERMQATSPDHDPEQYYEASGIYFSLDFIIPQLEHISPYGLEYLMLGALNVETLIQSSIKLNLR